VEVLDEGVFGERRGDVASGLNAEASAFRGVGMVYHRLGACN
jgi:hypothetical protein